MKSITEINKVVGYIALKPNNNTTTMIPIHSIRKIKGGVAIETKRDSEILKLFKQCTFRFEKNPLLNNNFTFNYSLIKCKKLNKTIDFGCDTIGFLTNLVETSNNYKFNLINLNENRY